MSTEPLQSRVPVAAGTWSRPLARAAHSRVAGAVLHAASVAGLVVLITFALVRLVPGDPVVSIEGINSDPPGPGRDAGRAASRQADRRAVRALRPRARGRRSRLVPDPAGRPISRIISASLPVSLALVGVTVLFSCLIGIPLGLRSALGGELFDFSARALMTVLLALPPFFLGLILILFISVRAGALPAGGWGSNALEDIRFLILPSLALAGFLLPLVVRVCRQAARHALREQWVEVAIARGISRRRIVFFHLLPNTLLPVITLVGYNLGALLTGAVVVESVFALPGIGQELVNAINTRDYPVIQGIALVSAIAVVLGNLLADLLSSIVDPRTRSG